MGTQTGGNKALIQAADGAARLVTLKYASVINAMPCLHNRSREAIFVLFPTFRRLENDAACAHTEKPLGRLGHIFLN